MNEHKEIREALKRYEHADDLEDVQRAKFAIELECIDWLRQLLDENQALQQEYADERASHNAHVSELLAAEKTIETQAKEIEQHVFSVGILEALLEKQANELQALREREVRYREACKIIRSTVEDARQMIMRNLPDSAVVAVASALGHLDELLSKALIGNQQEGN